MNQTSISELYRIKIMIIIINIVNWFKLSLWKPAFIRPCLIFLEEHLRVGIDSLNH